MCECNHTNSRSKSSEKINKKDSRIEYRIGGNLHGHSVTSRPRVYFRPSEKRPANWAENGRDDRPMREMFYYYWKICARTHTHTNRENVYTTRWKLSSLFSGCCNETERTEAQKEKKERTRALYYYRRSFDDVYCIRCLDCQFASSWFSYNFKTKFNLGTISGV